MFSKHSLIHHF